MKIVLVNHKNSKDINVFSGTPHFMSAAIREEFGDVPEYDMPEPEDLLERLEKGTLSESIGAAGRQLGDFLRSARVEADFVLCQGGTLAAPFYDYSIPLVYWHDSTWHTYLHGYASKEMFDEFRRCFPKLYEWDRRALEAAALAVFSSEYVAEACVAHYHIPAGKIRVIPFGANIYAPPAPGFLEEALIKRKASGMLNLTFLGKDWERKGLTEAYQLTVLLNAMGIRAKLNVIGCNPEVNDYIRSPHVRMYGFIDKSDQRMVDLLGSVLQETHFLVHPAISEPYGIALCEANAYGIPVLGTDIEGLKTIISNGRNGYLFDRLRFAEAAAEQVKTIYSDFDQRYAPLFRSSIAEFNRRLNWRSGVRELKKVLSGFNFARNDLP